MSAAAKSAPKPVRELVSAEEWKLRVDLAATYRKQFSEA